MVANDDNVIPPATERSMADRAGATSDETDASHVAMISQPRQITSLILDAARSTN